MGVSPRAIVLRLLVLVAVAVAAIAILSGCDSQTEPTQNKSQNLQLDSVQPASPTQDPNRVPVDKPKAQLPKQLN